MAPSIYIPRLQRLGLFGLFLLSWLSGVAFFALDRWVTVEGDFGPEKHPWQFDVLKAHGAAAFLMMIVFGWLLSSHVGAGWRVRRMRPVGAALVGMVAFQIVSAYFLYYLGSDVLRRWTSNIHAAVGFLVPAMLVAHLVQGRVRRKAQQIAP
ncbi:MAG: hypothetical protein AAGN66_21715 [Acidobacteriota bacterium]